MAVYERRTPSEVSRRFAEAINTGNLDGALECWSPAAAITAPDGSEIRGHAALAERFRALIAVGAQLQVSVSDEVCDERGATATTRMTMTVPINDEPTVTKTAAVVTYAPGVNGLQILADHMSSPAV